MYLRIEIRTPLIPVGFFFAHFQLQAHILTAHYTGSIGNLLDLSLEIGEIEGGI